MGRLISRRGLTLERGLGCPPLVCREMPLNVHRDESDLSIPC